MTRSEQIARKIFYSPATNGQAEGSIKNGIQLIESYAKEAFEAGRDSQYNEDIEHYQGNLSFIGKTFNDWKDEEKKKIPI